MVLLSRLLPLLPRHIARFVLKHQVEVALEEQVPTWLPERTARRPQMSEDLPSDYQQDRLARYQQMIHLHEQGMTQGIIAQQIGVSLNTVRRWLANGCPETARGPYVSRLDPSLPYLF